MAKDRIPSYRLGYYFLIGGQHVVSGRRCVISIIHEDGNVAFLEAMDIHNVLFHVQHIVVATAELTRIVT